VKKQEPCNGFICGDGWEDALCNELLDADPGQKYYSPAPGLVVGGRGNSALRCEPVFARQWFPCCVEVHGESIAELVQEAGRVIDPCLDEVSVTLDPVLLFT
jgi:hypothetical protein